MHSDEQPTISARPEAVAVAVQALWSVNAVSALLLITNAFGPESEEDNFLFNALILLLYALVTWKIGKGKHWARLTYAGLVALEVALLAAFGMDQANDVEVLATYLTTPLEFWALFKLFSAESEPWFKPAARP